jgi:hypothetical protein
MANLNEQKKWESGIYQYEITDPLQSGPDGIDNVQGKQLGNRTAFLKRRQDDFAKGYGFVAVQPRLASQLNVDIATGGLIAIDGVMPTAGDIVLLKDQTNPIENGLYTAATDGWARVPQYAIGSGNIFDNIMIDIKEGSTHKGKIFMIDALEAYAVGTGALTFRETVFSYKGLPGKILVRDRAGDFQDASKLGGYLNAYDFGADVTQDALTRFDKSALKTLRRFSTAQGSKTYTIITYGF